MADLIKLLFAVGCAAILAAALGIINLEQYGLGGVQQKLAPVISDIQAAINYAKNNLGPDLERMLQQLKQQ